MTRSVLPKQARRAASPDRHSAPDNNLAGCPPRELVAVNEVLRKMEARGTKPTARTFGPHMEILMFRIVLSSAAIVLIVS
jgi:hypothetical protein